MQGPGREPWEVYVVRGDSGTLCDGSACCANAAGELDVAAGSAAGCSSGCC